MQIKPFCRAMALSTVILTTACERGPLHRILPESAPKITQVVNSLKRVRPNTLNLKHFASDTIELTQDISKNPDSFVDLLKAKAQKCIPTKLTDTVVTPSIEADGKSARMVDSKEYIYSDVVLKNSVKTVIKEGIFASEDGKKFFVPVEYYGKPNPKVY